MQLRRLLLIAREMLIVPRLCRVNGPLKGSWFKAQNVRHSQPSIIVANSRLNQSRQMTKTGAKVDLKLSR
jgi:hypothetical protein